MSSRKALAIAVGGLVSLSLIKGIATAASITKDDMKAVIDDPGYDRAIDLHGDTLIMEKVGLAAIASFESVKTFLLGAAMTAPGGLLAAYLAS